jgi:hypothetical protein
MSDVEASKLTPTQVAQRAEQARAQYQDSTVSKADLTRAVTPYLNTGWQASDETKARAMANSDANARLAERFAGQRTPDSTVVPGSVLSEMRDAMADRIREPTRYVKDPKLVAFGDGENTTYAVERYTRGGRIEAKVMGGFDAVDCPQVNLDRRRKQDVRGRALHTRRQDRGEGHGRLRRRRLPPGQSRPLAQRPGLGPLTRVVRAPARACRSSRR